MLHLPFYSPVRCPAPSAALLYNSIVPSELQQVIEKLRLIQPEIQREFGVSGLWVFGSFVRSEQQGESDLDILVEFDRPGMTLIRFADLEIRLTDYLGKKVDLVQRKALRPRIRSTVLAEAVAV